MVAVKLHMAHALHVTAGSPFVPQLPATAAPEMRLASCQRERQGLGIHIGKHEHLATGGILQHRRYKTVGGKLDTADEGVVIHSWQTAGKPARVSSDD